MANKLFIPGPTEVRQEVLDAFSTPQVGHRTPEFRDLFGGLKTGLQEIFSTKNDVLISTSSGSGFWEAGIRSCVNKKVLHAVNGAFSSKWSQLSKRCGKDATVIDFDWGKSVKADIIEKELESGEYEAFCMVHNETSTGVMSDLKEMSKVMKKFPNVLWMVDAVSSIGGIKIEVDELGIDLCLASGQKALALPAGIAVASVSDRMYKKAETVEGRGYYFDLLELKKMYDKDMTPYTPSIPHLYGIKKQLERIKEEGWENRLQRHKDMCEYVQKWAVDNGFELFAEEGFRSYSISCIRNTKKDVDFVKIKADLATKGYSIDSGYGKMNAKLQSEGKSPTFRIAHMGDITLEEIKDLTKQYETYF